MTKFLLIDAGRLINLDWIHSITLNKNNDHAWVIVIEENDKWSKYKISIEDFLRIKTQILKVFNNE